MTGLAQNEMKAKHGMPLLVRSMEGLGVWVAKRTFCRRRLLEELTEGTVLCLDGCATRPVCHQMPDDQHPLVRIAYGHARWSTQCTWLLLP